jgi:hypothetical protein
MDAAPLFVRLSQIWFIVTFVLCGPKLLAAQSMTGTSGLFHVPNGYVEDDRTLTAGLIYIPNTIMPNDFLRRPIGPSPYNALAGYANYVFIPRLELQFRFTGNLGMEKSRRDNTFMDRAISARIQVLRESARLPAVVFGVQDFGSEWFNEESGSYFAAHYAVASKRFYVRSVRLGLNAGFAFGLPGSKTKAFDGIFGGVDISPLGDDRLQIMAEYDSFRTNAAVKTVLFDHIFVMAGLWDMKTPAGSFGVKFRL